jgi:hypothetical protein
MTLGYAVLLLSTITALLFGCFVFLFRKLSDVALNYLFAGCMMSLTTSLILSALFLFKQGGLYALGWLALVLAIAFGIVTLMVTSSAIWGPPKRRT